MTSGRRSVPEDLRPFDEIAVQLDDRDPLAGYRARFVIEDPDLVYLDGNSLGRLPRDAVASVLEAMEREWGSRLVSAWDEWIDVPEAVGDALAPLIGAAPGEVTLSDQTSVNLYKLASAALTPDRPEIVTDDSNFPSDLYVLDGVARAAAGSVRIVPADRIEGASAGQIEDALDERTGLVSLSHVGFRSGALADMGAMTEVAHEAGALVLWDLSHSAGVVPVDLARTGADLAIGCTYKYLNGGPGAPAFLFVRRDLQDRLQQPIRGWWGHDDMFAFSPAYVPAAGIRRFAVGTPPVLSLIGARVGIELTANAGIDRIRDKSIEATGLLIEMAHALLRRIGFRIETPREPSRRGSHVALRHEEAYRISRCLRDHGVIVDFRAPDTLRLGVSPLYTSYGELREAVDRIEAIVVAEKHLAYPAARTTVT